VRGELCALRWDRLDLDRAVLGIRTSIAQERTRTWEKDTKSHQQRRIALDANTVALLRAYRQECELTAAELGITLARDGQIFSASPDHATWLRPSSVSNRFVQMCKMLGRTLPRRSVFAWDRECDPSFTGWRGHTFSSF
jgi:integrase